MTGAGDSSGGSDIPPLNTGGAEGLDSVGEINSMLEQIDSAIETARNKIESGRVYDADNENVRIQWLRAFGYLLRTKRQILDDRDRAEMVEEIQELNERQAREQYQ